jgi:hypothetical protein
MFSIANYIEVDGVILLRVSSCILSEGCVSETAGLVLSTITRFLQCDLAKI